MQVIHNLGILTVKKEVNENAGFLMTNKKGSYCSFFSHPSSRYHGLFYFDEQTMRMHKFIDSIDIQGAGDITSLKNGFYYAERVRGEVSESFFMPQGFNSLIYEIDSKTNIDLFMDCKDPYDNREWGRFYEISEDQDCIIIKFTKKTDKREDSSDGEVEYVLYLAIKTDGLTLNKYGSWVERHYYEDENRNSPPFKRHVYNALRLKGRKFVFSMSTSKAKALEECMQVYENAEEIKGTEKANFFGLLKKEPLKKILTRQGISSEAKVAYVNAANSLWNLSINTKNCRGILAGLPWFFQFWARDSLISMKAIYGIDKDFANAVLMEYLKKIGSDGKLSNLVGQHASTRLGCADAHGWLFLRSNEIINRIKNGKESIYSIKAYLKEIKNNKSANSQKIREYIRKCQTIVTKKEKDYQKILHLIETSLEKSIHKLIRIHTADNLEVNSALETWMDTDFSNDTRSGPRIEIQALRLQMYHLMHELNLDHRHKSLENIMKLKVREKFWNRQILADGLGDFTIRPNIFIAAYAYPELLLKEEWEKCFENALKSLWLDWGGLSTIDKNNPLFTTESTGEDIRSYHRGDSWFWVNNLAAITLNRINKDKFKESISKILEASTHEILWKGCIGCHSELSSAKELRSEGCCNQAWSNAMYLELIDEVFH